MTFSAPFYHGILSPERTEELLVEDKSYLARRSPLNPEAREAQRDGQAEVCRDQDSQGCRGRNDEKAPEAQAEGVSGCRGGNDEQTKEDDQPSTSSARLKRKVASKGKLKAKAAKKKSSFKADKES